MNLWNQRPTEVENLLNHAFLGRIIRSFVQAYYNERKEAIPYELLFIFLPLVLQEYYRNALPKTTKTSMHIWLQNNPQMKMGFANKNKDLTPFVRETIIFLMNRGLLAMELDGKIKLGNKGFKRKKLINTTEVEECIKKAKFIGKWFAKTGTTNTIFVIWGIRP
ncbi:three component ABC system middle component [Bacillus pretiosus]|uniref:three component ABC system middle component n=1 Tax=Bacillus pretiosus TaxID=2983392 RepID=UPI003D303A38